MRSRVALGAWKLRTHFLGDRLERLTPDLKPRNEWMRHKMPSEAIGTGDNEAELWRRNVRKEANDLGKEIEVEVDGRLTPDSAPHAPVAICLSVLAIERCAKPCQGLFTYELRYLRILYLKVGR